MLKNIAKKINNIPHKYLIIILSIILIIVTVGGSYLYVGATYNDGIQTKQTYGKELIQKFSACTQANEDLLATEDTQVIIQVYQGCSDEMENFNKGLPTEVPRDTKIANTIMAALSNVIPSILVVISFFFMQVRPLDLTKFKDLTKFIGRNLLILGVGILILYFCLMKINGVDYRDGSNNYVYKEIIVMCSLLITLISTMAITFIDDTTKIILKNSIKVSHLPIGRKKRMLNELATYEDDIKNQHNRFSEIIFNRNNSTFVQETEKLLKEQLLIMKGLEQKFPKEFPYIKKSIGKWNKVINAKDPYKNRHELILNIADRLYKDVTFITSTIDQLK